MFCRSDVIALIITFTLYCTTKLADPGMGTGPGGHPKVLSTLATIVADFGDHSRQKRVTLNYYYRHHYSQPT